MLIKSPSSVVYASVNLERKQCDYSAAKDAVKHPIQVHIFEHWSQVVAVFWEVLELSGGWVWVKEVVTDEIFQDTQSYFLMASAWPIFHEV